MTKSIESMYIEAAGDVENKKITKTEEDKVSELEYAKLGTIRDSLMFLLDKKEDEARVSIRENYASLGKSITEEDIENIIIEKRSELIKALIPEDKGCVNNIDKQLKKNKKIFTVLLFSFFGLTALISFGSLFLKDNFYSFFIFFVSIITWVLNLNLPDKIFDKKIKVNYENIIHDKCRCDRHLVYLGYRLRKDEFFKKASERPRKLKKA